MMVRLEALALACVLSLGAAVPGQTETKISAATLAEMQPGQLISLAWQSERIDLDYETALAVYVEAMSRPGVDLRLRLTAYQRAFRILRQTGRFDELTEITKKLTKDKSIPKADRDKLTALVGLLERQGPRAKRAFRKEHAAFRRRSEAADTKQKRAAARQSFDEALRRALQAFDDRIRRGIQGRRTFGFRRRAQLSNQLTAVRNQMRQLERDGKSTTQQWKQLDRKRRNLEGRLRMILRERDLTQTERRKMLKVHRLEQTIDDLDRQGRFADADGKVDEGEQLFRTLGLWSRRQYANPRRMLRNPIARRRTLVDLKNFLEGQRVQLDAKRFRDAIEVIDGYLAVVEPLHRAKRWREAASYTLARAEKPGVLQRLWRRFYQQARQRRASDKVPAKSGR